MAESYSTSLKITLIGDGDLAGTWGDTTNTNWNLTEQAITGVDYLSSMGDSNYTLTNLNGISDEARNQVIVVPSTTTLSATRYVYAPYVNKTYIISNQSSGSQSIYIQGIVSGTPTGSPLLIPNGVTTEVYCDGVNGFFAGATGSAGNFLVNGNFSVTGSQVDVGNMTVGGNLGVTGTSTFTGASTFNSTATFNGIPSGPTASAGTSTTQLATTAFVTTAVSNAFPSGTRLLFSQAAAPTGWTQDTSDTANNRMMRVVSSTGNGVGGSYDPTIMSVVPSHTHGYSTTTGSTDINHTHGFSGSGSGTTAGAYTGIYDSGHNHTLPGAYGNGTTASNPNGYSDGPAYTQTTSTGNAAIVDPSHAHNFSVGVSGTTGYMNQSNPHGHSVSGTTDNGSSQTNWTPRYVNIIICQKN
jgi:hypothetical protein